MDGAHVCSRVVNAQGTDVDGDAIWEGRWGAVARVVGVEVWMVRMRVGMLRHGVGKRFVWMAWKGDIGGVECACDVLQEDLHRGDVGCVGLVGPRKNVPANSTGGPFKDPCSGVTGDWAVLAVGSKLSRGARCALTSEIPVHAKARREGLPSAKLYNCHGFGYLPGLQPGGPSAAVDLEAA